MLGMVFTKIFQFIHLLEHWTFGLAGFLIGEVSCDAVWLLNWILDWPDHKCDDYHPGQLLKSWWDEAKSAWHELWGTSTTPHPELAK